MANFSTWMKGLFTQETQKAFVPNTVTKPREYRNSDLHNILFTEGVEQRVEVNQRALVDKLLARYKGEFTVFRELIQNSDDAEATAVRVEVHRQITTTSVPETGDETEKKEPVTNISPNTIVFRNNGKIFTSDDWNRLTKIAEGNPQENSVGCFGVGFYSVFSLTEKPIIRSGNKDLLFFWREDQLSTMSKVDDRTDDGWTEFIFPLEQNTKWEPNFEEFANFLAQSLAFTTHLQHISIFEDDRELYSVSKTTLSTKQLRLSGGIQNVISPYGLFRYKSIESKKQQYNMKNITTGSEKTTQFELLESTVQVLENAEEVSTQMERILKKRLPKETKVRLLFPTSEPTDSLTQALSPYNDKGKVFIGFVTHQTTGCGFHLAAQFLPTVERENIDFSDYYFKKWNSDLIFVAGRLSRYYYDAGIDSGLEMVKLFSFNQTTPAVEVAGGLVEAFFFPKNNPVNVPTSMGTQVSTKVYLPYHGIENFIQLPLIPEEGQKLKFFKLLKERDLLKQLSVELLVDQLVGKVQDKDKLLQLLRWYMDGYKKDKSLASELKKCKSRFLAAVKFTMPPVVSLQEIKYYGDQNWKSVPTPQDFFTWEFSKNFTDQELQTVLELKKMDIPTWWNYIAENNFLETRTSLDILEFLSKRWGNLSQAEKKFIVETLKTRCCIVTTDKKPMRKPSESYMREMAQDQVFKNLPYIDESLADKVSIKMLKEIGVRTSPDVKVVFGMLNELEWNTKQLIDFLITQPLDPNDWEFLKNQKLPSSQGDAKQGSDLYFPNLVTQHLGLAILKWDGPFSEAEKAFLKKFGLKEHPQLKDILKVAATTDDTVDANTREAALKHLVTNFNAEYREQYRSLKPYEIPHFIPSVSGNLCKPSEVYSGDLTKVYGEKDAAVLQDYLQYQAIVPSLLKHAKDLKVQEHASVDRIKFLLDHKPPSDAQAKLLFDYAGRFHHKNESEWKNMSKVPFIPQNKKHVAPASVFLPSPEVLERYGDLLNYVPLNGLSTEALHFLKLVGCQTRPTPDHLVEALEQNGARFLKTCGVRAYLLALMDLSRTRELSAKSKDKLRGPILLGFFTDQNGRQAKLCRPCDCYLVDNTEYQRLFNPLSAPDGIPELEAFYQELGSPWLTSRVRETTKEVGRGTKSAKAQSFEELVRQRQGLLLHDLGSCSERDNLKPTAKTILKNLNIVEVSKIKKELILEKTKKEMEASISLRMDSKETSATINITDLADEFALASILATALLSKKGKEDSLKFSAILSASITSLRLHGYPVDRLLPPPKSAEKKLEESHISLLQEPTTDNDAPLPQQKQAKPVTASKQDRDVAQQVTTSKQEKDVAGAAQQSSGKHNSTPGHAGHTGFKPSNSVDASVRSMSHIDSMISKAISNKDRRSQHFEHLVDFGKDVMHSACEGNKYSRDVTKVAAMSNGIAVYEESSTQFEPSAMAPAEEFSQLLFTLAQLFQIKKVQSAVNIFVDKATGVVAFNKGGALWFNLLFYQQLHFDKDDVDAVIYWYIVFCHELAHDFVSEHSADHSFISEHLATSHFKQLMSEVLPTYGRVSSGGVRTVKQKEASGRGRKGRQPDPLMLKDCDSDE